MPRLPSLRTIVFWTHLTAGVTAGLIILIMCVTGVLLTYEREMIAWSDSGIGSTSSAEQQRLPAGTLLARLREVHPEWQPTTVTFSSRADAPVTVTTRQGPKYVDAYSATLLGESQGGVRRFMSAARAWHRWLAVDGERRPMARLITGYSNLIFLFLVISGAFIWFPRVWNWKRIRPTVLFSAGVRGKARDFNWHNTIGSWSAIPLLVMVVCALPMSFTWANASLYRLMGDEPPRPGGAMERDAGTVAVDPEVLDAAWAQAVAQESAWKTITLRLPASRRAPLAFTIDRGDGGQPQLRSTLTLDQQGQLIRYETFADQKPGARLRAITRFAHTGEIFGLTSQTIAGSATLGGAVLVWTGISLAMRRLRASIKRRAMESPTIENAA